MYRVVRILTKLAAFRHDIRALMLTQTSSATNHVFACVGEEEAAVKFARVPLLGKPLPGHRRQFSRGTGPRVP